MRSSSLKIIADENMPWVETLFSAFGDVILRPGRDISQTDVKDADALLVRSITPVNQTLLADSSVKFVGTATIGTDHIDQQYLAASNIAFSNAPGCNAEAVVDYVLSNIFLMAERYGFDPRDRTFGIIGVGNVGSRLYQRLSACGFKVLLNDPPRAETESGFSSLSTVLSEADFICLHTPLTKQGMYPSYHLLNSANLAQLREGACLLNAGRGPVIDNEALKQLCSVREDIKVILDVWEHEPYVDPLLAQRCEIVSPHIAGYSLEGKIRGTYMLYEAFCRYLGEKPQIAFNDVLPAPQISHVDQGNATLNSVIKQVYDPTVDDMNLRQTLSLPKKEQMLAFDQLRKQYRVRREFSSLTVSTAESKLLEGIGFKIAQ